jgi:Flp pilus assembly protein TadG
MVEFAIVGAVFSAMLLGILESGLAAWQRNSAAADAREGVRYAAVHGSRSGTAATAATVAAYVKMRTSLDTAGIRVYTEWPAGNKDPGSTVKVSVAHNVPRRGPFIPQHVDSTTAYLIILN